ncbi:MAG: response regulator transcription factor [Armatimonadetes bacterium]|nr:response regulator transcription factor [Armatimonadota bacterium]
MQSVRLEPAPESRRGSVSAARILLVEDDAEIRSFVRHYLEEAGYQVEAVREGRQALDPTSRDVDLVMLDVNLPDVDGLEIIRRLRATGSLTPIIVVSGREEESDRVSGLEVGADDYVCKPFRPRELLARIRALLRRARMPAAGSRVAGPLLIDPDARRAWLDGRPLDLTPLEYHLLRTLAGTPGKNFTREELLDLIWGDAFLGETRRVDLLVSKLRAKLRPAGGEDLIRSVWGVGYRYEA